MEALQYSMWNPVLPITPDGEPLATKMSDMLPTNFPQDRNVGPAELLLRPDVVLAITVAYVAITVLCIAIGVEKFKCDRLPPKTDSKDDKGEASPTFKFCMAVHNFLLVVFSGVTCIRSWTIVLNQISSVGYLATYCDKDNAMWNGANFGAWATIFYLSKYWEFADTVILILKGKVPSVLQVYHHAGIALAMWGSSVTQGSWIAWVVCLNSFIHTVMYTYFLLSTLGIKVPGAKYLTAAQIIQFFTGIFGTIGVQLMGEECDTEASRAVLTFIQIYAVGLIVLFGAFFGKKYKKKDGKKKAN